ncbi:hypothetical protein FQN54_001340 [Arachnomyces sp. PD_36]|nr:hypothetical protein FQN54_001340 [Arachnomyces sp. PD_36]
MSGSSTPKRVLELKENGTSGYDYWNHTKRVKFDGFSTCNSGSNSRPRSPVGQFSVQNLKDAIQEEVYSGGSSLDYAQSNCKSVQSGRGIPVELTTEPGGWQQQQQQCPGITSCHRARFSFPASNIIADPKFRTAHKMKILPELNALEWCVLRII